MGGAVSNQKERKHDDDEEAETIRNMKKMWIVFFFFFRSRIERAVCVCMLLSNRLKETSAWAMRLPRLWRDRWQCLGQLRMKKKKITSKYMPKRIRCAGRHNCWGGVHKWSRQQRQRNHHHHHHQQHSPIVLYFLDARACLIWRSHRTEAIM